MNTLLVISVGGEPAPIRTSIVKSAPARVIFVTSPDTRRAVEDDIIAPLGQHGLNLDPGRYRIVVLDDYQNLTACLKALRSDVLDELEEWTGRGADYEVVVDYTGGTKCMAAALALSTHRVAARFSYVGGTRRTGGNVGTVLSGHEQMYIVANPWDELGYLAIKEACVLFDGHSFVPARDILIEARRRTSDERVHRELSTLVTLVEAYDLWDRFNHADAWQKLKQVRKNGNDLLDLFPASTVRELLARIENHVDWLHALKGDPLPTRKRLADLVANAIRRAEQGRYDDAVARLYRAVEATAQHLLWSNHGLPGTTGIPLDQIPEPLRTQWAADGADDGTVDIGLQDAFALLGALGDPVAETFKRLGWEGTGGHALTARNASILAHGFRPMSERDYEALLNGCMELTGLVPGELPSFPRLSDRNRL